MPDSISSAITRREAILRSGSTLFREKGYTATSMQDIAGALGIKAASLYNHIKSKHDILSELLMEGAQLFTDGMFEIKSSSLKPITKIEKLIGLHVQLAIQRTDLMALMTVEWRHLEPNEKKEYVQLRTSYEDDFKQIMLAAKRNQEIIDIEIDIALFSMLTTLQRFYAWYDRHLSINALDLEKDLVQCLLGGIRTS